MTDGVLFNVQDLLLSLFDKYVGRTWGTHQELALCKDLSEAAQQLLELNGDKHD